jgi:hypothetical protein
MANKFPHVAVIGIDLAPGIISQDHVPDNCRIELDDVNRGLVHFYGQMDLVHMRSVASGVSARIIYSSPTHLPINCSSRNIPRIRCSEIFFHRLQITPKPSESSLSA